MLRLFASCLPGLEELLAREAVAAGLPAPTVARGGIAWTGDAESVLRANLWLGLAGHVLVRIGEFHCRSLGELERKAAALAWDELLHPSTAVAVHATARKSRLYHTGAIAERVARALGRRLGSEADADVADAETPPLVHVRLAHDRATLSVDTSGEPLHRRGYRIYPGPAPLREDLARALLLASGWQPGRPLLEPFAGSGTIAIEAALLARGAAPGARRAFAVERTRLLDRQLLERLRAEGRGREPAGGEPLVVASDRDREVLAGARRNAVRAGVADDVAWHAASLGEAPWPALAADSGAAVVSNPPLGGRLGDQRGLAALYRALGQRLRALPSDVRVALACFDRRLTLRTGLDLRTAFLVEHGGRKLRAMVGAAGARRQVSDRDPG